MYHSAQIVAVIPAAGSGRRMNANVNKIWLPLCGQTVLDHTLKVFQKSQSIDHIVLAVNQAEIRDFERFIQTNPVTGPPSESLAGISQREFAGISLVAGGAERQQSVANALQFLKSWPGWSNRSERLVVIHDAARALLTFELLERAISAGLEYKAAGVGVPVKDTIKQVNADGLVAATLDRSRLWAIQTPQAFHFDLILSCYEKVSRLPSNFSDDCGVVEYCGHPVKLIEGSYENLKITTPGDLIMAGAILRARGNGGA
jgi:2-C-methyl-D-erythritol 4-phosphate cytidylyltransferase